MYNTKNQTMAGEIIESGKGAVFEWLDAFIFAFVIASLVFGFVLQKAEVDGDSMNPTLSDQEQLIVYKFLFKPKYGDVVVINPGEYKPIVKRVIGVPGDEIIVDYENSHVYLNGEILEETYIKEAMHQPTSGGIDFLLTFPIILGKDEYFVMGDNRNNSLDSRFGTIGVLEKKEIMGKVIFRYYPTSRLGIIK